MRNVEHRAPTLASGLLIASSFNGIVNEEMANSIIVYSAIPGTAARNGLFTPILTKRITEKGRSFYDVLQEIRKDVHTSTGGEQRPFWYGASFSDISLTGFD